MERDEKNEKIKILVVDDHEGMRVSLEWTLKKRGYEVTTLEDGYQAIEKVKKDHFHIIFMDIKMPGINGVETFIKIKEISPKTRVIMMTAFAVEDLLKRAMQEGAYAVVYKPFEIRNIFSVIDQSLQSKPLVLIVDDLSNDRTILKKILEDRNYRVIDVNNGYECLKLVQERSFDVIMLDIKIPGMNGVETLIKIREFHPKICVVMMTGYSVEDLIKEAMRHGSYTCLYKPFDIEKVIKAIDDCIKTCRDK